MIITTKQRFKDERIPKVLKKAYNQLHVLEFDGYNLLIKNPFNGYDEKCDITPDLNKLDNEICRIVSNADTDVFAIPYDLIGDGGTLIDFRGCYKEKYGPVLDTKKSFPDMPAAIIGAMAYAASLGYTAIAIHDPCADEICLEDEYPGITTFMEKAFKEHEIHDEAWTNQE